MLDFSQDISTIPGASYPHTVNTSSFFGIMKFLFHNEKDLSLRIRVKKLKATFHS